MADPGSGRLRGALLAALLLAATAFAGGCGSSQETLFEAEFGGPERLLTNEFAYAHPRSPQAVRSSQWLVTSGSLFAGSGAATNGHLDDRAADAHSTAATNSAVFRAYTKETFVPPYQVEFDLRVEPPRQVTGLRPKPWDGLHLMVDAESPEAAYYVSLYRRNGQAVIKKKSPGGPIAGGSYKALSHYVPSHVKPGDWCRVRVDVHPAGAQGVTIDLYEDGILLATATDDGADSGSPPFSEGQLGIRADKTSFAIKSLTVLPL